MTILVAKLQIIKSFFIYIDIAYFKGKYYGRYLMAMDKRN